MEKTGELMMGDEAPMSVAMPSDKAMTLIIYKNYHDHWVDKHEKKEVVRSPKYTKQEGVQDGEWSNAHGHCMIQQVSEGSEE
jgi:hypothetical protein